MARNKFPEETIDTILNTALNLFVEKGTDNTSIQDIIDKMGGLSKGAIYHHFESKNDIIKAVVTRLYEERYSKWLVIINKKSQLTGLEKLRELFRMSFDNSSQLEMFFTAPSLLEDSKMLALEINNIYAESVPKYIQPIIEQGIKDGSIQTDFPKEMAESILILASLWLSPRIFYVDVETMKNRFQFFNKILLGLGLKLFDDQMLEQFEAFCGLYDKK